MACSGSLVANLKGVSSRECLRFAHMVNLRSQALNMNMLNKEAEITMYLTLQTKNVHIFMEIKETSKRTYLH